MAMERPVYMTSSERRIKHDKQPLPCLGLVRDYHRWMGGVDGHDPHRMQKYSVYLAYKSRNPSKFVHRVSASQKDKQYNKTKYFVFLKQLKEQLLTVNSTEPSQQLRLQQRRGSGQRLHRRESDPRQTPMASMNNTTSRKPLTQLRGARVSNAASGWASKYLCNVGRDRRDTIFCIWHWKNGNEIVPSIEQGNRARNHPPASRPGKKHIRRAVDTGVLQTAADASKEDNNAEVGGDIEGSSSEGEVDDAEL
ncbi:LOW QUALITY PROTEIN: hypothetical protein PHMEG_0005368 [Phytophthora megakarya]|uniref:Uncharacterized protein n=1 Tax=Phytophthora megakarya TaxID=4795 RepID=A0A225WT31_9STRA|nr:LOW QUALITY PROTEIN: hypothetical protein PHMEG_0005368 [Phytophthora megakarya]